MSVPADTAPKLLLTQAETADAMGVSIETVRNWTRAGILPVVRFPGSRSVRYSVNSIKRVITQHETPMAEVDDGLRITEGGAA